MYSIAFAISFLSGRDLERGGAFRLLVVGSVFFSPNSFSYRGSYFKYRGEASQIFFNLEDDLAANRDFQYTPEDQRLGSMSDHGVLVRIVFLSFHE